MMEGEAKIDALLKRIGLDANAAAELMALASEYLETGEPLPKRLSEFLGQSFRRAMEEPSSKRADALAYELGFTAPAREGRPRKPIDHAEVQAIVEEAFANGGDPSDAEVNRAVGERFSVSPNTAAKHVKAELLVPRLLKASGLESLIPPRKPPQRD